MRGVRCAHQRSAPEYELVLEPSGLLAATTGYLLAPVVGPELVDRVTVGLREGDVVEQAYLVGVVAEDGSLGAGDEGLRVPSG